MLLFIQNNLRLVLFSSVAAGLAFMLLLALLGQVPLTYNFRNLVVRWRTTLMTALAFTLVIGLMTFMLAFVNGMYQLTVQSGQPGNVIVLSDGATDETFSNLNFTDSTDIDRQPGVLRFERGGEEIPLSSKEVYIIVNQQIPTAPGEKTRRRFVQVRGIEDPVIAGRIHGLDLPADSKWFDATKGVATVDGKTAIQAVLGSGLAADMGGDRPGKKPLQVGETFDLGDRLWVVSGVLNSSGSTFDSEVWAKRTLVGPIFGKENVSTIVLRSGEKIELKDGQIVEGELVNETGAAVVLDDHGKALRILKKQIQTRQTASDSAHKLATSLKEFKGAALNAMPESEYFAKLAENSKTFLYAAVFVAGIMAIGGGCGVMNTMFAAISQRKKDIGVLRIVGFRRRHVLMSFLLESLCIALVGGLLGCAVGMLADGATAKSVVSAGQGGSSKFVVLKLAVSPEILSGGLLLSLLMGGIGGFVPAISAMLVRPLESLR